MQLFKDRKDVTFAGIIVLVHVVFFLLACRYARIYMGDSYEYIYEACNIKNLFFCYSGNPVLPIEPEYMTQRQPLYPLLLMGVYLFSVNNWIVLLIQNVLSVFNILYVRKLFLSVGFDAKYDRLLLLLLVAYPAQFINANTIAPDILLQTFTVLYISAFVKLYSSGQLKDAAWMSLWLIAGLFVKPVLYPFVIVHVVIVLLVFRKHKAQLQRPMAMAVLPLCAVLLYNYSNYTRTGKFHFSSNQSFNAIYYFKAYYIATQGVDSGDRFIANERKAIAAMPEYKDRYDVANERGMTLLKQHFVLYMWFHVRNAGRIFIEPGKAEIDLFTGKLTYGKLYTDKSGGFFSVLKQNGILGLNGYVAANPSLIVAIAVLLFNLLRAWGMMLFFFDKRISRGLKGFVFVIMAYFAMAAGPIANTRYFLPVSLIVISCAAMGWGNKLQHKTIKS